MNKQFRLKFNRLTNSLDAVSEIATNAVVGQKTTKARPSSLTSLEVKLERNLSPKRIITATMVAVLGMGATLTQANANSESFRSGMNVVAGSAAVDVQGTLTQITTKGNTILNWQKFGINSNEVLKFIQESSNNAVLNRVLGGQVSQILGQLQSNGKVFIVNPAGIVFGQGSSVDVNSLVASTLDISNDDFLKGKYVFNQEKDQALASVINAGMIKVQDNGTLALIGGKTVNRGVLEASNGAVYLLAGKSITIQDLDNPLVSYKVSAGNKAVNLGSIIANKATLLANKVTNGYTTNSAFSDVISVSDSATKAQISATGEVTLVGAGVSDTTLTTNANDATVAAALANTAQAERGLTVVNGTLVADNATGKAGIIKVLGDQVKLESQAQVSDTGVTGGQVFIGGDSRGQGSLQLASLTQIEDGAVVNVSAQYNAGTAVLWGNHIDINGIYYAQSVKGKGGFIETSGRTFRFADSTRVDTRSQYGTMGTYLLDPDTITIQKASGDGDNTFSEEQLRTTLATTNFEKDAVKSITVDGVSVEGVSGNLKLTVTGPHANSKAISITNTNINTTGSITLHAGTTSDIEIKNSNLSATGYDLTASTLSLVGEYVDLETSEEDALLEPLGLESETVKIDQKTATIVLQAPTTEGSSSFALNIQTLKTENSEIKNQVKGYSLDFAKGIRYDFGLGTRLTAAGGATVTLTVGSHTTSNTLDQLYMYASGKGSTIKFTNNLDEGTILTTDKLTLTANGEDTVIEGKFGKVALTNLKVAQKPETESNSKVDLQFASGSILTTPDITAQSAKDGLNITVDGQTADDSLTITDGSIASNTTLNIKAGKLSIDRSYVQAKKGMEFVGYEGLTFTDSTSNGYSNKLWGYGDSGVMKLLGKTITIDKSYEIAAEEGITIEIGNQTTQSLQLADTVKVTATKDITLQALEDLTIKDNALVKTDGNLKIDAPIVKLETAKTLEANAITVTSTLSFTGKNGGLKAGNDILITSPTVGADAFTVTANRNLTVNSEGKPSSISVANSLWTATTGSVTVTSTGDVDYIGSNLTAGEKAKISGIEVNISNSNITGKSVEISGKTSVKGNEAKVETTGTIADSNVTIKSDDHIALVNLQAKTVENGGSVEIYAPNDLSLTGNETIINSGLDVNITSADQSVKISTAKIDAVGDVIFTAENGKVSVTESNLSSKTKAVKITADDGIDLTASNISGYSALVIKTTNGDVQTKGGKLETTIKESANDAKGDISITSVNGKVDVRETNITSAAGAITLEAATSVDLSNTQITGDNGVTVTAKNKDETITAVGASVTANKNNVELIAKEGSVEATDSKLTAKTGKVIIEGKTGVTAANAELSGDKGVTLSTALGDIAANGAKVAAANGNVEYSANNGKINAKESNVTAGGEVTLTAKDEVDITNANITAGKGVTILSQTSDIKAEKATVKTSEGNVEFTAAAGSIDVKEGKLTADNGQVILNANKKVDFNQTEIFGKTGITIKSNTGGDLIATKATLNSEEGSISLTTDGKVALKDSSLIAPKANVDLKGKQGTSLDNTDITSLNTNILAEQGSVTITNSRIAADNDLTVTAGNGHDVTITDANLTAQGVTKVTGNNLSLTNVNVSGVKGVELNARKGNITAKDSSVISKQGPTTIKAVDGNVTLDNTTVEGHPVTLSGGNLSVTDSTVTSPEGMTLEAIKGSITTGNSTFDARNGSFNATAKANITLGNGTVILSKDATNLTTTDGAVTVTQSNITVSDGNFNVKANTTVNLDNANISALNMNLTTDTGAITAKGSKLNAPKGVIKYNAGNDNVILSSSVNDAMQVVVDGNKYPTITGSDFNTTFLQNVVTVTNLRATPNNGITGLFAQYRSSEQYHNMVEDLVGDNLDNNTTPNRAVNDNSANINPTAIEVTRVNAQEFMVCNVNPSDFYVKYDVTVNDQTGLSAQEIVSKYNFTANDASSFLICNKQIAK